MAQELMEFSEILFEIFSRLSLKNLGKLRLVSKQFNNLTYEWPFMNLHRQRTTTISGYFVQSTTPGGHISTFLSMHNPTPKPEPSLGFLPGFDVEIVASVRQVGLMLCFVRLEYPETSYMVCKPSTKQYIAIPNPNPKYFTRHMGMIVLRCNPLKYKIVRLSSYSNGFNHIFPCEVFDSETFVWRQLKLDVKLPTSDFLDLKPTISVSGSLHWLTHEKLLLSFRVEEEKWELIPLPQYFLDDDQSIKLAEYCGKLALMISSCKDRKVELWVMESLRKKAWSKRHTICTEAVERLEVDARVEAFYGADIVFIKGFYKGIFYNFKTGSYDVVKLNKHMYSKEVFAYESDCEPLHF